MFIFFPNEWKTTKIRANSMMRWQLSSFCFCTHTFHASVYGQNIAISALKSITFLNIAFISYIPQTIVESFWKHMILKILSFCYWTNIKENLLTVLYLNNYCAAAHAQRRKCLKTWRQQMKDGLAMMKKVISTCFIY